MYDREPLMNWVSGSIALLGDSAHPPLQYIAQGAVMAIEDGWVLGEHVARHRAANGTCDWQGALAAYQAVRPEHCRRVLATDEPGADCGPSTVRNGSNAISCYAIVTSTTTR